MAPDLRDDWAFVESEHARRETRASVVSYAVAFTAFLFGIASGALLMWMLDHPHS